MVVLAVLALISTYRRSLVAQQQPLGQISKDYFTTLKIVNMMTYFLTASERAHIKIFFKS